MKAFNAACNFIAEVAHQLRTANKVRLQHETYYQVREQFGLSSQLTVRAISKVCEAYKRDRKKKPRFRADGSICYDQRLMSFKGLDRVSLLTLDGRQIVSIVFGTYQAERMDRIRGQADLVLRDGKFYLYATIELPEPAIVNPDEFLGVDMGTVNLATDSDGKAYSGGKVNGLRKRHAKLRGKLQKKGTKAAKRLLKKRSRKEQRFATHTNHVISKTVVATAKRTERGIAIEDLTGIRDRVRLRRSQRRSHHSWAFFQLRAFTEYKALMAGVKCVAVNPRNTSRTCPSCQHVDKANRPSQSVFHCVSCHFSGVADHIAARNIASRALVSAPHLSSPEGPTSDPPA